MTPDALRSSFLHFFEERGHRVITSSPVIPEGDPTLLFTNAGMNQFKDVLLGLEKRDYVRAASSQKCIRAGGKHNDLDEVGKDSRHLTFFEMLGNWSFGDYYKHESIRWAWDFVTQVLRLDPARLVVSVYRTDDEAWDIWNREIGLSPERILRLGHVEEGDEENFWSMGPTGPCGPCTEIYVDTQPDTPFAWQLGFDETRYLEIWNLVFMEMERDEDATLRPLPMRSVDTGMGLERVLALMEGVDHVFHTSVFRPILERTLTLLSRDTDTIALRTSSDFPAFCVIADHIRTLAFSVSEGATFSNEGRGYVLRRILRRAVRYGRTLGFDRPFLCEVASAVVQTFGSTYPELRLKQRETYEILRREEERFFATLDRGIGHFEEVAAQAVAAGASTIGGESVFRLYDTYGFPPDLTRIMAEERSLGVDLAGYEREMEAQRERSRAADVRYDTQGEWVVLRDGQADRFCGYTQRSVQSEVLRYRVDVSGDVARWEICLRETPFYAESGGQVGDRGILRSEDGHVTFRVVDTKKTVAGWTHFCVVQDGIASDALLQQRFSAEVDPNHRRQTAAHHSATHLLHAALHRLVSPQAFQAGSLVAPDRLRFDFNLDRAVSPEELRAMETWVNDRIAENHPVVISDDVSLEEAERRGAMMIFGEKYGSRVRTVDMPGVSLELCGGIHVGNTAELRWFRIVQEGGVAAGVRRIEALVGEAAFALAQEEQHTLTRLQAALRTPRPQLEERVAALQMQVKHLEEEVAKRDQELASAAARSIAGEALAIGPALVVATEQKLSTREALLSLGDTLRDRLGSQGVLLIATVLDDKPTLLVQVAEPLTKSTNLHAGKLMAALAPLIDGRGGGKPTMAQAGGKVRDGLPKALEIFPSLVRAMVTSPGEA